MVESFLRKGFILQKKQMGSTIHMHIEVKKDGYWLHYSAPSMLRDREFFDLIAGVHGDTNIPPIVTPRGLPGDLSPMTEYCYTMDMKNNRLHHRGWLSSQELVTLQRRLNELYPEKLPLEKDLEESYFHCYIGDNAIAAHTGFDDARLIFWFDN